VGYPGGKNGAGVYQTIINLMPPHDVYVEPFLGGGAVMRLKRPALVNIGLDLDAGAVRRFRRWLGDHRNLKTAIAGASADLAAYGDNAGAVSLNRLLVLSSARRDRASLKPSSVDVARFQIFRRDAISYLLKYPWAGGELVYCDPPYMHETRGRADLYQHEMSDAQHLELLKVLRDLPCRVICSGYWTALYACELAGWKTKVFNTTNRAGKKTTEWLWFNFPEPVALHDYRYLGSNFRERERIKRKKLRWVARLQRMPILEKRALLSAIDAVGGLELAGAGDGARGEV